MLVRAIERAGYRARRRRRDLARHRRVRVRPRRPLPARRSSGRELDRDGMIELLLGWLDRYPIVSIEDPLAEDDRDGWIAFTRAAGTACRSSATTTSTTNAARVRRGRADGACNAVLIKPNQAGTLTETQRRARRRHSAPGFGTIVSARSGETEDVVDRRTSPSAGTRPAQGRLVRALASAWRSGTRRCASRKRWARRGAVRRRGALPLARVRRAT